MDYTRNQLKAIGTIDQNLQIIACAGSGKTQVMAAQVAEILKRKKSGIGPGNIVAFTFTDRAAGELKDRIHRLCKEQLGTDRGLADMYVGTIHGYCLDLLQSPPLYKYLKYTVLPDVRQRLLIDRHSKRSGLTQVPLRRGGKLRRWQDSRLYQQLIAVLGEGNVNPRKVPAGVKKALKSYHRLLDDNRYLDYTQIIAEALEKLRTNATLREQITNQVKYLIVDEYQDVNPLQELLVSELHALGANICVVGDDDQTIFQWRGSEVANIIGFASRYPRVEQISLNENFRSSSGVVRAARHIIEKNPQRLPKKMETKRTQRYERGDILALAFTDPKKEAQWVAAKIKELMGTRYRDHPTGNPRGLVLTDFAVLLRSVRNDAEPILAELDKAKIAYVVGGVNKLFDTSEIKAMRAAFYFLTDWPALKGRPFTDGSLKKLFEDSNLGLTRRQAKGGVEFLKARKSKIGKRYDAKLYLQRVYLDLLESMELREEEVTRRSGRSGELVYYNLGKFSQVISDFENINFHSRPDNLYLAFANFLHYQVEDYYPEGWMQQEAAKPLAVQVMTVHQAKGMQWPVVFIPCLRRNRFPSRRQGGRSVWHVIPEECVQNADKYKGLEEDERRLFYVAMTRAEKYLYCSWAPVPGNNQQRKGSKFHHELTGNEYVLTKEPIGKRRPKSPPRARKEDATLALTFSELKYYFECPYLFKLRFLYGFDTPVSRALGYGKSLHDALAEIHAESIKGNIPKKDEVPRLIEEHLHLPFSNNLVERNLQKAAKKALEGYLTQHSQDLDKLEHVERIVELKLADGVLVNGRIDLIRKTDTGEVVVVDFKSKERVQVEDVTKAQLHIYSVGYEQLTGSNADLIEIHNLTEQRTDREVVDKKLVDSTLRAVESAGKSLRANRLPRLRNWAMKCVSCEMAGVCRRREAPKPTPVA